MHSGNTEYLELTREILESRYIILFIQNTLLGPGLSILHSLSSIIIKVALCWLYYYCHFAVEKTDTQRDSATCPRSLNQSIKKRWDSPPQSLCPEATLLTSIHDSMYKWSFLGNDILSHLKKKNHLIPNGTIISSFPVLSSCPNSCPLTFLPTDNIMPQRREMRWCCLHVTVLSAHSRITSAPKLTIIL